MYVAEMRERISKRKTAPITNPEAIVSLIGKEMRAHAVEHFVVISLDARHAPVAVETISVGTLNSAIVHPRDVFRSVLSHNAAAFVVSHNHPSGDPEPSAEDLAITRRLVDCGELFGIGLLDHVVIGAYGFVSMRARGIGGLK